MMYANFLIIFLQVCLFNLIISSKKSFAVHYQYLACLLPTNCGQGPNISFPFYIPNRQQSYCGYPGFNITCNQRGFPILTLSQSDYVVENIYYENRSVRVYNAALLNNTGSCVVTSIRNTGLDSTRFSYFDETGLHLFSNCTRRFTERRNDSFTCEDDWSVALYDGDHDLASAAENCDGNVVAPVEWRGGNSSVGGFVEVLRRGVVLNWTASDCSFCENSGGRCGFNESAYDFRCFCTDGPHARYCPRNRTKSVTLLAAGTATAATLLIVGAFLAVFMWKKRTIQKQGEGKYMDIEVFLKNNENLAPKRYKYSDLKKITNSFSDKLGKGGFGSVYKGKLQDGRLTAVNLLNESNGNGEDFMNEVASISRTSHVNIVILLGFCFEGTKRALIYEFMPNGSLDKFIRSTSSLTDEEQLGWEKLFEITFGVARGLEYLHQGCNTRILHLDIKPHNILLDKDFRPKISDFGLAKLCPDRASIISMLGARGTVGYIAPEVFCRNFGDISHKSDVYSFGMLVLEMVGRKNVDVGAERSSESYFPDWIYKQLEENADEAVDDVWYEDEGKLVKRKLTIIGLWCIQTDPKQRPSITRVVEMLECDLESLQIPPKPYLFSPANVQVENDTPTFESSF